MFSFRFHTTLKWFPIPFRDDIIQDGQQNIKKFCGTLGVNSLGPSDTIWCLEILVNIGSGNDLLPDGTKPLPEPLLTYQQWDPVAFISG